MNYAQNPERRRLLKQARKAVTLEEIDHAWNELRDWKRRHPDDVGIEDAFEPLALMRLAAEEQNLTKAS